MSSSDEILGLTEDGSAAQEAGPVTKVSEVNQPGQMTDIELAETVARLERELVAIPTPEEAEKLRNEKQKQIHRYAKEQQRRAKKSMRLLSDAEIQRHMQGNGWMHQLAYAEHRHRVKKLIKKMDDQKLEELSRSDRDLEIRVLAYEEHQRRKQS